MKVPTIRRLSMKKTEKLGSYVEMSFDYLNLNYESYFGNYNFSKAYEDTLSEVLNCKIKDGALSRLAVKHASRIIGVSENDILNLNEEPLDKWHEKYCYFDLVPKFRAAYRNAYYADGNDAQKFLSVVFDDYSVLPTKFNESSILKKLIATLKELDEIKPGTFHKNAKLENVKYRTRVICSFPEIERMVDSYLKMYEQLMNMFYKALEFGLSENEINEYNLLVSVFGLSLTAIPTVNLYYDFLLDFKALNKTVTEETFNKYIRFRRAEAFEPWLCKEFIENRELVQKYVDVFPKTKSEMREFSVSLSTFECCFSWSDDEKIMPNPEDDDFDSILGDEFDSLEPRKPVHVLYIEKADDELFGFREATDLLNSYCKPEKIGGIKAKMPKNSFDPNENIEIIQRLAVAGKMVRNSFIDNFENESPYLTELNGGGSSE